jgi:RNA polymerase sigma factor (sigma-70 family)
MARAPDKTDGIPPASGGERVGPRLDMLYRSQAPQLRRRIRGQLRSSEEAHDLVQDAFVRLLGASARQVLREPEAFLNRIVRNLLIDRARRRTTRAMHVPLDEDSDPGAPPSQADALELADMRDRYRAAVNALPERMREVFLLHRIEELGYREIATRLGISHRTVEWHIAEAIVRIGKGLEQ